jgi:uncharacterized membrane protein (UPF0136 family)
MPDSKQIPTANDQNKSLGIFLSQALQNNNWREIKLTLPGSYQVKTFSRQQAEKFLQYFYLNPLAQLNPDEWLNQDINNPATLKKLNQYLLFTEIGSGDDDLTALIRSEFQKNLERQTQDINQRVIDISDVSLAKKAAKDAPKMDEFIKKHITEAIQTNLQDYPLGYQTEILKAMAVDARRAVIVHLENGGRLDASFSQYLIDRFRSQPLFHAAIKNTDRFQQNLTQNLTDADPKDFLTYYHQYRNLQITIAPQYHHLVARLSFLPEPAIKKIVSQMEGLSQPDNPLAVRQALEAALAPYENELRFANLNLNNLSSELAFNFQCYLTNPDPARSRFSEKAIKFTKKLNLSDGLNAYNTQAFSLYAEYGYSSKRLKELGVDKEIIRRVEEIEAKKSRGIFGRYTIEGKTHRMHKKAYRKALKASQHELWRKNMSQKWYGWLRCPRMRLAQTIQKSTLGKTYNSLKQGYKNLVDNSSLGWLAAPRWRAKKALGNFIIKTFSKKSRNLVAERLGATLIKEGFLKFGRELVKQGLIKLGLGFLVGGPVGTAIGLSWTAIKTFYDIFKDPELRKKVLEFAAKAAAGIFLLIFKFPFTFMGTVIGFSLGGPVGSAIGGFIGFILDKSVVSLGGLAHTAGNAVASAALSVETALGIPAAAASAPLPLSAIAIPVFSAIGLPAILGIITITTISSAMFAQPAKERGGGIPEPLNIIENYNYEDIRLLAAEIVDQLKYCGINVEKEGINKNNWNRVESCLQGLSGNSNAIIDALHHSVWEVAGSESLQCVGFVMASLIASGRQLAPYNAASYTIEGTYPGWTKTNSPSVGDLAVWGPRSECSYNNLNTVEAINEACNKEIACCGHIGIVTKVERESVYITSAWDGKTGIINTIEIESWMDNKPWLYLH